MTYQISSVFMRTFKNLIFLNFTRFSSISVKKLKTQFHRYRGKSIERYNYISDRNQVKLSKILKENNISENAFSLIFVDIYIEKNQVKSGKIEQTCTHKNGANVLQSMLFLKGGFCSGKAQAMMFLLLSPFIHIKQFIVFCSNQKI